MVKKVIIIHSRLEILGGAERVFLEIVEVVKSLGLDIEVITMYKPLIRVGVRTRYVLPKFVKGIPVHLRPLIPMGMIPLTFFNRASLIILSGGVDLPLYGTLIPFSTCNAVPKILYLHNIGSFTKRSITSTSLFLKLYYGSYQLIYFNFLKLLRDLTLHTSSLLLCNSNSTRKKLKNIYPNLDCIVVYPPVNTRLFSKVRRLANRKKLIVTIARIDPAKNLESVIEVAKKLVKRERDVKFIIIGFLHKQFEWYYKELIRKIKSEDLENNVKVVPGAARRQTLYYLARAKLYFHPPVAEGFGVSIVEAMSAGVIPVVWDFGGPRETVPAKYRYRNLEEASSMIENLINQELKDESERVSHIAEKFSRERFKNTMKKIILRIYDGEQHVK